MMLTYIFSLNFITRVLQGALVGAGAILPGISGGVLLVAFGIYEPMMALLSHPIRSFKQYYKLFIPFLLGWLAGFLLLAKAVEALFAVSSGAALMLFAGLILGTVPGLLQEAAPREKKGGWASFVLPLVGFFLLFQILGQSSAATITPNIFWYAFCGLIWGLSLVIPGLSSSSLLIFMGLYQPMTAGIAALDPSVLLPLVCGLALTVLLSARFVNRLFAARRDLVFRVVTGIVIASTLSILPAGFSSAASLAFSLLAFSAGFAVAAWMDRSPFSAPREACP